MSATVLEDCSAKEQYLEKMADLNPNGSTAEKLVPPKVVEYEPEMKEEYKIIAVTQSVADELMREEPKSE